MFSAYVQYTNIINLSPDVPVYSCTADVPQHLPLLSSPNYCIDDSES